MSFFYFLQSIDYANGDLLNLTYKIFKEENKNGNSRPDRTGKRGEDGHIGFPWLTEKTVVILLSSKLMLFGSNYSGVFLIHIKVH